MSAVMTLNINISEKRHVFYVLAL